MIQKFKKSVLERPILTAEETSELTKITLTGVAQWAEHCPAKEEVTSSIPYQGTCLPGWQVGPQLVACESFSPSLSASLPLSLKLNK